MLAALTCLVALVLGQAPAPGPAATPGPGADEEARAAQDRARAAQEQARAALEQSRVANERAAQLDAQVASIQAQLEAERQRRAQLEQQLADERARQEQAAEAPGIRREALTTATADLAQANAALAAGSGDVAGALSQAQVLADQAARSASTTASPQEAALAAQAQRWLVASQEALQRGDLFQARQAVDAAARATQQARALAASGSAGNVPPPAAPAATGMGSGTTPGY